MIHIFENFVELDDCLNYINFFEQNINQAEVYRDTWVLRNFKNDSFLNKIKIIENKFAVKINYYEIVKWPEKSQQDWHKDGLVKIDNNHSGILYLNENFVGGETVIEDKKIRPKTGSFVFFEGSKLMHKVNQIIQGSRYTMPCWFRNNVNAE